MKILNKLSTSDNIGNATITVNYWDGKRYKKINKCDLLTPFGEGNGNPLQYSCLEIPWTEKPGRLQSMGLQGSDTT